MIALHSRNLCVRRSGKSLKTE